MHSNKKAKKPLKMVVQMIYSSCLGNELDFEEG